MEGNIMLHKRVVILCMIVCLSLVATGCIEEPEEFAPDGLGDPENPGNIIPDSPLVKKVIATEFGVDMEWFSLSSGASPRG